MSDEQPTEHRSWLERLGLFLTGEPEDREDLLVFLRDAQKRHVIDPEALSMIEGVMQFSELQVRDIMVPRVQMVVVPQDADLETIFPLVVESAHSRYPVIGEDRTEVVGILLAKDLLAYCMKNRSLLVKEVMRPAGFVPESKRLNALLREFRATRNHMAIVVDEYGAAAGLVTIEDILEQIVGDIEDEHDFGEEEYISRKSANEFTLKALTPIDEFNEYFKAHLRDDEFDTVGGLIVHKLGHLPCRGERVDFGRYRFIVIHADNRRVQLLKLVILPEHPTGEDYAGD